MLITFQAYVLYIMSICCIKVVFYKDVSQNVYDEYIIFKLWEAPPYYTLLMVPLKPNQNYLFKERPFTDM